MGEKSLDDLLGATLGGLGYELVDIERAAGGLMRVYIDRSGGVNLDDCVAVSNHLNRLLPVEGVDYQRLEVSSPGLDRPLKRSQDFQRFTGERAQVKTRVPIQGRRNFVGILRGVSDAELTLEVDGTLMTLELAQIDKAKLAPIF